MKLFLYLSLASIATSFSPVAYTATRGLTTRSEAKTVAFLFGRNKENGAVLDRPEEEMVKLNGEAEAAVEEKTEEELSETEKLLAKVKAAGTAGVISYAAWELAFWFVSVPVVLFGYRGVTGHWPDLSNNDDVAKLGAEAFAFVNFARFAVPLRIGLALSTTPWIQDNIVDKFFNKDEADAGAQEQEKVEQMTE